MHPYKRTRFKDQNGFKARNQDLDLDLYIALSTNSLTISPKKNKKFNQSYMDTWHCEITWVSNSLSETTHERGDDTDSEDAWLWALRSTDFDSGCASFYPSFVTGRLHFLFCFLFLLIWQIGCTFVFSSCNWRALKHFSSGGYFIFLIYLYLSGIFSLKLY